MDDSIRHARELRQQYREELLANDPGLRDKIQRPSEAALASATELLRTGTVAAADGTLSAVPLLGGSKIQVGVVIVSNQGEVVDLVTRVFEVELSSGAPDATSFFADLRRARGMSNLLARAVMAYGERRLLRDHQADWRMIHGELVPYELRTGSGRPGENLEPVFDLVYDYVQEGHFIAVSESPQDLDLLNAAIILEPGEFLVLRTLEDSLLVFLEGDEDLGKSRAKFSPADERRFRAFIEKAGPEVAVLLIKAGERPFLLECHKDDIDDAAALFLADAVWTRGLPLDGLGGGVRPFPFHIDLADRVAGTLFKSSDFQAFVEARVMTLGVDQGLIDLDPRRTRS